MKKGKDALTVLILAGVALLLGGCATMGKTDVSAFRQAVEETWESYSVALLNGNPELFLSLHAENVVKMPPDTSALFGLQALGGKIRGGLETLEYKTFDIKLEEVEAIRDLGFARGTYTFSATVRASGATVNYDGKYLTVFKKQADGSWKIYRDCYNSNVPPPK